MTVRSAAAPRRRLAPVACLLLALVGLAPVPAQAQNAAPTGAVTIDDTMPEVGETLTADVSGIDDPDGLTSPGFTYQWIRVSSGTEALLPGATAASYTVVAADEGATLKVEVTFTDDGGTEETVESAETATVAAATMPTPPMSQTLISNLDRYETGNVGAAVRVRRNRPYSQWFRTGSAAGGYTLHGASLRFRSFGGKRRRRNAHGDAQSERPGRGARRPSAHADPSIPREV